MHRATLFCLLLIVCVNDAARGDTEFIYNGFSGSNLHLDGAAYITQDGILSLTTCSSYITGYGFHPMPLRFASFDDYGMDSLSFSATFVFAITPDNSRSSGDGMAFVISSSPFVNSGKPAKYLGLNYQSNSRTAFLAIELDTVLDTEFLGIDNNHVGIDLNNLESIYSRSAGYQCNNYVGNKTTPTYEALRLSSGDPMQVWVDYNGISMVLNVTLAPISNLMPPSEPLLSYTVNLSNYFEDSHAQAYYVGFSATTDDMHCTAHQILGWSFSLSGSAPALDYSRLPLKRAQDKKLIKWLLPAAISSLAVLTALTCFLLFRCCRKRSVERQQEDWDWETQLGPRRFSHKVLRAATSGFSTTQLLGQGGFGRVCGGVLTTSGLHIAVKRISSESSAQGPAQFTAEILILGHL
ncbi:hypothetical protein QOZ80_7AG0554820 [Eleusine coracana subsp. coracana]|nr:hypothetical protein QOZ80_7AG0554820 [Eleusine coracana subsp. coracana]